MADLQPQEWIDYDDFYDEPDFTNIPQSDEEKLCEYFWRITYQNLSGMHIPPHMILMNDVNMTHEEIVAETGKEIATRAIELLWTGIYDLNFQDSRGQTLLHKAVQTNELVLIKMLIGLGADVNQRDTNGDTPLSWFLALPNAYFLEESTMTIALLLENDADITVINENGVSVMFKVLTMVARIKIFMGKARNRGNEKIIDAIFNVAKRNADLLLSHARKNLDDGWKEYYEICRDIAEDNVIAVPDTKEVIFFTIHICKKKLIA